jgi:hypothetical protein
MALSPARTFLGVKCGLKVREVPDSSKRDEASRGAVEKIATS